MSKSFEFKFGRNYDSEEEFILLNEIMECLKEYGFRNRFYKEYDING